MKFVLLIALLGVFAVLLLTGVYSQGSVTKDFSKTLDSDLHWNVNILSNFVDAETDIVAADEGVLTAGVSVELSGADKSTLNDLLTNAVLITNNEGDIGTLSFNMTVSEAVTSSSTSNKKSSSLWSYAVGTVASLFTAKLAYEKNTGGALAGAATTAGVLMNNNRNRFAARADLISSVKIKMTVSLPRSIQYNAIQSPYGEIKSSELKIAFASCGVKYMGKEDDFITKCSSCCSRNGRCTKGGCVCKEGFTGNHCEKELPKFMKVKTGLPYTLTENGKEVDTKLEVLSHLQFKNSTFIRVRYNKDGKPRDDVFVGIGDKDEPSEWIVASPHVYGNSRLIGLTHGTAAISKLYIGSIHRIVEITKVEGKEVSIVNVETPEGTKKFNNLIIGSVLSRYLYVVSEATNPKIFKLDSQTNTWEDMKFSFTSLDGKPHINIFEDKEGNIYYESNYSGTFMYTLSSKKWSKPEDVTAPLVFRRTTNNPTFKLPTKESTTSIGSDKYTMFNLGLPTTYQMSGLVFFKGYHWVGIKNSARNGVYVFSGKRWEFVAESLPYGIKLFTTENHLCVLSNGHIYVLDYENNEYAKLTQFFKNDVKDAVGGKDSIYTFEDTVNPKIFELSEVSKPFDGKYTNLKFPFTSLDGKPHVSLSIESNGNLWYKSNYAGVFRYEKSTLKWDKASDESGAVSIDPVNNKVYLSYEVQPTTQISSIFLYRNEAGKHNWDLIHEDSGYGIEGVHIGNGRMFMMGGRFREFVVKEGKKWNVPEVETHFDLNDDDSKSVRFTDSIWDNNDIVISCVSYLKEKNRYSTIMAFKPKVEISDIHYDSNTIVSASTYVGSKSGSIIGTKVLKSGSIVVAVNSEDDTFGGKTSICLLAACDSTSKGRIVAYNSDLSVVEKVYTVGKSVLSIAVDREDSTYVIIASESIIGKLSLETDALIWSNNVNSDKKRVKIAKDQRIIALTENTKFSVYDKDGKVTYTKTLVRSYIEDVEIDSENSLVFVGGYDNKKLPSGNPIQVAFLEAYKIDIDEQVWSRFSFDSKDLSKNIADTRIYGTVLGKDNKLYVYGESAGTETIFRYDGKVYEGKTSLTFIDFFTQLWNTKSAHFTAIFVFDPKTGNHIKSQFSMARLSSGLSNSYRVKDGDLTADVSGNVYQVGVSSFKISNRDANSVNGEKIASYAGNDPVLQILNSDFKDRQTWTSLVKSDASKQSKGGELRSVDISGTKVIVGGNMYGAEYSSAFTTGNAVQKTTQVTNEKETAPFVSIIENKRSK